MFDRNIGEDGRAKWRPKVLPPRSEGVRRGLFSTRSPHRPNPIGMSVVQLTGDSGLTLSIRGSDMLDGTPVLDIKPYVPYADVRDDATTGWLAPKDPLPAYAVEWSARAVAEAANGVDLVTPTDRALALGPQPHAYRRIRETKDGKVLAVKEWRVHFTVLTEGRALRVDAIASGYREKERETRPDLELHRAFVRAFSPN